MTEENRLVRVAVDAMGGDYAPEETVSGAVESARKGVAHVMLVGDPDKVQAELEKHETDGLPISTYPSEGVVVEGDSPATVLRQKRRASILVATNRVKKGEADAVVTMGSTGAAMASAAILLGVIKGIERPALGGPIIGLAPRTAIIDLGTNVDCKPTQLLGFAVIGHVFAQQFWGTKEPRVATLSVGAEVGKGNQLVKDASELISSSSLNFVGNIEANEIMDGKVDVAVCDGFVGNVVMKLTEGLGRAMSEHLRDRLRGKLPDADMEHLTREVYDLNNVAEAIGGGPILGVNGVSVVGHGRARAESVQRAIETARVAVEKRFVANLNTELARVEDKLASKGVRRVAQFIRLSR